MISTGTLSIIVTISLFFIAQLIGNIVILAKLATRVTRIETHLIHLMQERGVTLWSNEQPPGYQEGNSQ